VLRNKMYVMYVVLCYVMLCIYVYNWTIITYVTGENRWYLYNDHFSQIALH